MANVEVDQASEVADVTDATRRSTVAQDQANEAAYDQQQVRTIRHANLYLTRVDPWSIMKNAFLLSLAIAIILVVAVAVMWWMITASGTLSNLTRQINEITGSGSFTLDLTGLLSFSRVMGVTAVIAAIEVVLLSALATLFAYLYNLAVGLTGGIAVTLTEDH